MAKSKSMSKEQITKLAITGILTALVIVLQALGSFIKLGSASVTLVLVPIIVGAALCGPYVSTWLGLVFSIVVLMQPDTAAFMAVSIPGTIITVLLKGMLCGLITGLVFTVQKKMNTYLTVVFAAVICPIVNTGIFLLGGRLFFYDAIKEWGAAQGFTNAVAYMFVGMVGLNFVFELIFDIILSPAIVRVVNAIKKQ